MDLVRFTSHRGFSVRRILMFAMTVLVTVFLTASSFSPLASAQGPTADWVGESILYNGKQYFPATEAKAGESHGLPAETKYYVAYDNAIDTANDPTRKAYVIYFASGVDPPTSTTAKSATYDISDQGVYSNRQDTGDITLNLPGTGESFVNPSSCDVDGIGWFICPITVHLASAMDRIFDFISLFVTVQPLTVGDTNSPLHTAWNVMRSFANVAFIILFLIIIYSQLTSWGISNYGLKKLIPRLVVAAVLVNISFYITALAVDVSNILGHGLQDMLNAIRENNFAMTGQSLDDSGRNWSALVVTVLSGGAIAGAYAGVGGAWGGVIYLVVPLLVGLILTATFVLLVLAARQAIIVILIVISPLAFVANLLPNTEKWFDKWRDLFMNMLLFFPAFSLVFGGSQLASSIIMQNATGPLAAIMLVFGLAVQVAPLLITPLILKLSGGILGRIAQIANDPRKGALDRSKNWANDRFNMKKAEALGKDKNPVRGWLSGRNFAQMRSNRNENVKRRTAIGEKLSENRYLATDKYAGTGKYENSKKLSSLYALEHDAETGRTIVDSDNSARFNNRLATNDRHRFDHALQAKNSETAAAMEKERLAGSLENAKNGVGIGIGPQTQHTTSLMSQARQLDIDASAVSSRLEAAQAVSKQTVATAYNIKQLNDGSNQAEYLASQALIRYAGGIQGEAGMTRARARATAVITKMNKEALDNNVGLIEYEALQAGKTAKDYSRDAIIELAKSSNAADRAKVTSDQIEAAYEIQAADGQVVLLEQARDDENIDQSILDRVYARNSGTLKGKLGFHLQANPQLSLQRYLATLTAGNENYGKYGVTEEQVRKQYKQDMTLARVDSLSNTVADQIGNTKYGAFVDTAADFKDKFLPALELDRLKIAYDRDNESADGQLYVKRLATARRIHNAMQVALTDDGIYGSMTDRLEEARLIDAQLSAIFDAEPIPRRDRERRTQEGEPERPKTGDYDIGDVDPTAEHAADSDDD